MHDVGNHQMISIENWRQVWYNGRRTAKTICALWWQPPSRKLRASWKV